MIVTDIENRNHFMAHYKSRESVQPYDLAHLWGYHGGSPTAIRLSDPALCGSCPTTDRLSFISV